MKYRFLIFILVTFLFSGRMDVLAYRSQAIGIDHDLMGLGSNAQELTDADPQDQQPSFLVYKVKKKNTLHYIAKRFGVEVDDILKYNPEARNGLKTGQVLRIPDKDDLARIAAQPIVIAPKPEVKRETVHHVVGDETLYSISKKYNCSIASLLKLNPEARTGLKIGMDLQIPAADAAEAPVSMQSAGDSYFMHLVESGETFWGLEKKYQTSQAELIDLNPALKNGLLAGLRIKIPLRNVPDIQVVPADEQAFDKYKVAKGETLYKISKQSDVKIPELKRVNPVLNYRGLVAGETILIPRKVEETTVSTVETPAVEVPAVVSTPTVKPDYSVEVFANQVLPGCEPNPMAKEGYYQIGLLLPLYLPANDTINRIRVTLEEMMQDSALMERVKNIYELPEDSFRQRENEQIYSRSENFLHFYEGTLLAVDSLQKAGMKVQLNVFDTNQSQDVVDSLIQLDVFLNLDLIIGPVYPDLQVNVASFAYKNRIPMVSPLSAAGKLEENNPYYFKVNPTKEFLIRQTANYIAEEYFDKNLIVLQMGEYKHLPEAELVDLCREKFFFSGYNSQTNRVLFHEYNFPVEGYWGLTRILSKDQENVFIIPSETEAQISVGVTNLNAVAEDYPVTLVGLSNFQRYKSIQTEYFHHTNMNLLSPYFVDYNSKTVNRFIRKFRQNFEAEPNQFSFQGYDVAFYFMSALYNYGKDFIGCLPSLQVDLTQGEFSFDKVSRFGGYMNSGLFIVDYDRNYNVTTEGVIGKQGGYALGE